jgi:uncharacterized membrane protein YGL010W
MKSLTDQLAQYAGYHRNPRNIGTHFIGIPMIVAAVIVLLSRPAFVVAGISLSPAILATGAVLIYYFLLDMRFGCMMAILMSLALWFGAWCAKQPTAVWLVIGAVGFFVGWGLQFVGHHFEGRKPAFVDDLVGLLIGPLFVVAEALFMLGFCEDLQHAIEARAGTVRSG